MTSQAPTPTLGTLDLLPYLDAAGEIPPTHQGRVGIYAIFDQTQVLQYVGYSRDVYQSLKQHLVRQPHACHWYKVQTIDRPSRTLLEEIRSAWIAENGTPPGNQDEAAWTAAIDAAATMTPEEKARYATLDELGQIKFLKNMARRLEVDIFAALEARGVTMALRFNPKLKESGLLDLKS